MSTPTDDGRQIVARGRIRVDARRALAKLREHLLVDLHLYATEIARAAIASKATFLDIEYDVDDVILTFDGQPAAANELPRLLDHVLGDGQSTDRHLRGLALGVNAALGLGPAFVDIYVCRPDDERVSKVRFVPSVLESENGDLPTIEKVAPAKGMLERGTRVHVRRRMGMSLLKRAATREVPREVVLLSEALHSAPLKLTSRGAAFVLPARPRTLIRVPFKERELRRGIVEILQTPAGSQIEYLELGVLLVRKPFVAEPILPSTPHAQVELPFRVTIDADELPTNASRSALREDSQLPSRAEHGAREALVVALQTLVTLVLGQGKPLPNVEIVDADPKKLEEALGAIVCVVAGASRRGAELSEQARSLLDLPLLQNAVGMPMTPSALLQSKVGDIFVHHGKEPHDKELSPWLEDVVWLRGKMVERILVDFGVQDAKTLMAAALVARERRRVLHARPSSEPMVPEDDGHVVRDTFRIHDGPFQGLRGQLALGAEGQRTGQRPTSVRIYIEGRHIDTLTIDRDKLPLCIDAAIAWDGQLQPKYSYEGVKDDAFLRLAIFQLTRLAIVALGTYFERSLQEKRAPEERAGVLPLVRAAIGAYVTAAKTLGVDAIPDEPPISAHVPIWSRGAWISANPDRLPVSLAELKTYSDRTKAICYVAPGSSGVAPDGRPVVVLTNLEREWLGQVFPGVTFVPYERALRSRNDAPSSNSPMFDLLRTAQTARQSVSETLPSMTFEMRDGRGVIAPGAADQCLSLHVGVLLSTEATNKFVEPATIVVEHDATVPNPTWNGILWSKEASALVFSRNELLEKIVHAMEGDADAKKSLRNFPQEPGPILRAYLIEAVARFRTKDLGPRIEKLPLVHILDADGRPRLSSLANVASRFPDPQSIPFLRVPPSFPTLDWQPLFLEHEREVAAILRWAGSRAKIADDQLEQRSKLAQSEMQKRTFLQRPRLRLDEPGALADPSAPSKVWQEQPKESGEKVTAVVAALPRRGMDLPVATAEILFEERLVCTRPLIGLSAPVVARVFLPSDQFVIAYADISPDALTRIESFVYSAACALVADLVARAEGAACEAFFQDRRGLLLLRQLYSLSVNNPARSDILTADFALRAPNFSWPTVQGEWRSYSELVPGGGKLYYGTSRYEKWEEPSRAGSELDVPIVYLPPTTEGTLAREILAFMGHEMVDVSSAVYTLQSRRKPGSVHGGPTLSGSPPHSALRFSMASIGLDVDGEIELTDGSDISVRVETLHGSMVELAVTAPISFRAVVRVEDVELDENDKKRLAESLAKSAVKCIESLAGRLDELPHFVRVGLRKVVVKNASRGRSLSRRRKSYKVFPDMLGEYHSLSSIEESGESPYPYVTFSPSSPVSPRPCPPLCLTTDEANALSSQLTLEDVTAHLRREFLAIERKNAAPVSFIGLSVTQRLECLDIVPFQGAGVEGEVAILAPENADNGGIWVHKNRRALCKLSDPPGWPLLAVINDDSIPENKTFDGIKGNGSKDRVRQVVRAQADAIFAKLCVVPENVLAGHKVRATLMKDSLVIRGALWLPRSWLNAGSVEVRDSSNRFPTPRSFGGPNNPERLELDLPIPVCGRLFVANTGAVKKPKEVASAIGAWLFEETTALVLDAVASGQEARAVEGYQWLMRFLGGDVGKLEALAADGRRIDSAEIMETLKAKKEIWVTQNDADIEGEFPGDMPPFILRGQEQAIVDVLRARTSALRDFAAVQKPLEEVKQQAVQDVVAFHFDNRIPEPPPIAAPTIVVRTEAVVEVAVEPAASWWQSVVQRVVVFFDRPAPMEPWTKELGPSLLLAIDKLGLTNTSVVTGVRYVRRGRPMVFDEASGELVINHAHKGVRALAARVSHDSRARLLLVVLAVREINRVLEVVTDAAERRALLALLRGESL